MELLDKNEEKILFSILVCTYNGAERLPATLKHIAALHISDFLQAELIVVNNACTDHTDHVVKTWWEFYGSPFGLKLLQMPLPGKSNALQMGVCNAEGKFIINCDDDNWLASDYLLRAFEVMEERSDVGIAGGYPTPTSEVPLPSWFANYQWAYACGAQFPHEGITTGKKPIWGAGMVLRGTLAKIIFQSSHPFLLSCRIGSQLISGGDDEICYRSWLLGCNSFYTSNLRLQHFMPAFRLTFSYRDKLLAGFKHQVPVVGAYQRLYDTLHYNGNQKLLFLRKWFAWQLYRLSGNSRQSNHAADTLYYITGNSHWETKENKTVKRFYDELVLLVV
jgi:glycosyltransferase involved in cell wall biosynthesis